MVTGVNLIIAVESVENTDMELTIVARVTMKTADMILIRNLNVRIKIISMAEVVATRTKTQTEPKIKLMQ